MTVIIKISNERTFLFQKRDFDPYTFLIQYRPAHSFLFLESCSRKHFNPISKRQSQSQHFIYLSKNV